MKKKRLGQWMLLAIVCLSFSVGETYAQKHEFANYKRYATENAALAQPVKKEKRVVFMGNSITEGWVRHILISSKQMDISVVVSVARRPISFYFVLGKM